MSLKSFNSLYGVQINLAVQWKIKNAISHKNILILFEMKRENIIQACEFIKCIIVTKGYIFIRKIIKAIVINFVHKITSSQSSQVSFIRFSVETWKSENSIVQRIYGLFDILHRLRYSPTQRNWSSVYWNERDQTEI